MKGLYSKIKRNMMSKHVMTNRLCDILIKLPLDPTIRKFSLPILNHTMSPRKMFRGAVKPTATSMSCVNMWAGVMAGIQNYVV